MNNKISIGITQNGVSVYNRSTADEYWEETNKNFLNYIKTQHNQILIPAGGMEYRMMIRHIDKLKYDPKNQTFKTSKATRKSQFSETL